MKLSEPQKNALVALKHEELTRIQLYNLGFRMTTIRSLVKRKLVKVKWKKRKVQWKTLNPMTFPVMHVSIARGVKVNELL